MYTTNIKINNQLSLWLISMFWIISFMIVVGGLTRLTDSGLSITKWELFKGLLPPLSHETWLFYFSEYKNIPEFKKKQPASRVPFCGFNNNFLFFMAALSVS